MIAKWLSPVEIALALDIGSLLTGLYSKFPERDAPQKS
jgi:hypothetical protein